MPPKYIQVHYAEEIVKLMLMRIHQLMSEYGLNFFSALQDHVDIYRKTSLFHLNDPSMTLQLRTKWDTYSARLANMLEECIKRRAPSSDAEQAGLMLLRPYLMERIDKGMPIVDYRQDTQFGCFFYELESPTINLHFINNVMPESPFENIQERTRELSSLLTHCLRTDPNLKLIKFGSWLNDYPRYRQIFPESWHDSGERKKYNSFAWWGQFMNRQGDIHTLNAARFRETGAFPYQCTFHQCTIPELKSHLGHVKENNR